MTPLRSTIILFALLTLTACASSPPSAPAASPSPAPGATVSIPFGTLQAIPPGNDFSSLTYAQAFDKLFEAARTRYAFNGIDGKRPDWDALYADLQPRVRQAESTRDAQAYFLALRDFSLAFHDGNINLGGSDLQVTLFQTETEGGYGFAIRELDDGRVIVSYVMPAGPAEEAGMKVGAQVTAFNGRPIAEAIGAVVLWGSPPSMESSARYQQSRYLLRARVGSRAQVTFANPGGASRTVALTAVAERESFAVTSLFISYSAATLPVEARILPSGVGYARVTSTADNRDQIAILFEEALKQFALANAPGLIVDLRVVVNLSPETGLPALGLAGFLTDESISLGQMQTFDQVSGRFQNFGAPQTILPRPNRYSFPALALLVGPGCARTCEWEAYAFSRVPGVIVVGQYPTAGVMSDATGGQFLLPEGFTFQFPTGRYVLPDGSLFLEGQGVVPTLRVPVDETTVLATQDVILQAAEQAILK
ncbi:MAG: PDZ domain-containing protein [Chloroflexota bacterium]